MPPVRRQVALFAALAGAAVAPSARAQDLRPTAPYSSTISFGSGLINIPTAWVSTTSGDLLAAVSSRSIGKGSLVPKAEGSLWDMTLSLEAHLAGRLSLGASLYGAKHQQVGAFGQVLAYKQGDLNAALPSIAFGVRNVGSSAFQDRFVTGERRAIDVLTPAQRAGKGEIDGSPTFYGVATREFMFEKKSASLSIGYGSGLFRNDGGLDTVYNRSGTIARGLFLGGRVVIPTGARSQFALIAENDGWDYNAGALFTVAHVSAGVYVTEIEEVKGVPKNSPVANFTKVSLVFSYDANIPDIIRGTAKRAEAADADLEARRLKQEIAQRRVRADALLATLTRAQLGADRAAAAQRLQLQKQLEAEQEAMKRAADRLQRLQGEKPAGVTP